MSRPLTTSFRNHLIGTLVLALTASMAHGDEVLFAYEGDIHPSEVAYGSNPCEAPSCVDSVEDGHYVVVWPDGVGDYFVHGFDIAWYPTPPLVTLGRVAVPLQPPEVADSLRRRWCGSDSVP